MMPTSLSSSREKRSARTLRWTMRARLLCWARSAAKLRNGSRLTSDSAKSRSWKSRLGSGGMPAVGRGSRAGVGPPGRGRGCGGGGSPGKAGWAGALDRLVAAAAGGAGRETDRERGEPEVSVGFNVLLLAASRVSPARIARNAVARHSTSTSSAAFGLLDVDVLHVDDAVLLADAVEELHHLVELAVERELHGHLGVEVHRAPARSGSTR